MRLRSLMTLICTACISMAFLACTPKEIQPSENGIKQSQVTADKADKTEEVQAKAIKTGADIARLMTPAKLNETAPDEFIVKVTTTKGDFKIDIDRSLAPIGVDRFYNLIKNNFFDDMALFRMAAGFVVQFGIHGKPIISSEWRDAKIDDDPVKGSNKKGTLTFATAGPNTRTTQLFINLNDNVNLDQMGFAPFGKIVEGMDTIDKLNFEYGERPDQGKIQMQGNAYLKKTFPNLDYIVTMTIE